MIDSNNEIVLLYGSQGGTAKYVAERLYYLLLQNKYIVYINDMDSFDVSQLPNINYAIFIVSTIGYGQCPKNMRRFWDFIMRSDLPSILEDLNYTIFGLGDSSYEKFNYTARGLDKRLKQLGANCFFKVALSDEQHDFGYEGEYDYWSKELCECLNKNHFSFHSYTPMDYVCRYECKKETNNDMKTINDKAFDCSVIGTEYLTKQDALKQVVKITLESNNHIKYSPGDILSLYPENSKEDSDFFIKYYEKDYDINDDIAIYYNGKIILQCTFGNFIRKHLNISSLPKRQFCLLAAKYTTNNIHKEKLLSYGSDSSEGKGEFYYYCYKEKRTFKDFLQDFSSVIDLPINYLLQETGLIQSRKLSISSSQKESSSHIQLTLGLIDYYTELKRHKQGLISNYILQSIPNIPYTIKVKLNKGSFPSIPTQKNVLFIATGTGIAPIRSYLTERNIDSFNIPPENKGLTYLIYGCRHQTNDWLYEKELSSQQLSNLNYKAWNAFSRDNKDKVYVQNILLEHSNIFIPFMLNDCIIIIVGNSKFLPKAIKVSIIKGISKEQKITEEEAMKVFKECIEEKIHIESW